VDVWAARAYANGIGSDRASTVVDAVGRVVALQGQDVRANRLAARVRSDGLTHQDVDDAVGNGEVVRTWAMRGTLHMLAAVDLRWVLAEVGAYFRDRQAPRRRRLGLDDAACERGVARLEPVLTEPLTRAEIKERVDLDLAGQAAPYFLGFAALEGVICRGPERGSEPTYVLVRDWVTRHEHDHLALRYLRGHGPATPKDLAAWLLGHCDAFVLGYGERSISEKHTRKIQSGGGFVMPSVSVGGRIQGVRRLSPRDVVDVTPFTTISAQLMYGLSSEVADLGRFLGRKIKLSVAGVAAPD
jgi:hypothetical protein